MRRYISSKKANSIMLNVEDSTQKLVRKQPVTPFIVV